MKTISLKQKRHVLSTFHFWPKSLYPSGHFFWWLAGILRFWKYPSNSCETFKILFFHENNQFEAKTACFEDFSLLAENAVSGPYRRGYFCCWFYDFLKWWKYPSNSSEIFKIIFFDENNQFEAKTACFEDFSILAKIAVSGVAIFLLILGFFEMLKTPLNSPETFKIMIFRENNQFEAKTACFEDFSLLAEIGVSVVAIFLLILLIFWNDENTLPIRLKHSKLSSFIKTISLKQKRHVLWTFQFWPKSL